MRELTSLPVDPVRLGEGLIITVEGVDRLVCFRHWQDSAGVIEQVCSAGVCCCPCQCHNVSECS